MKSVYEKILAEAGLERMKKNPFFLYKKYELIYYMLARHSLSLLEIKLIAKKT